MTCARPRRRQGLAAAVLWLCLALVWPASAETRLDIPEARRLAVGLVQGGQPAAAREVARVLLQRDPKDVTALIVLARAERDLGDFSAAEEAGKRAYRLSEPGSARFAAAMTTAQALSSDGRRTAAQQWLRRAEEAAPDEAARAVAIRDFAYVRSRNPLTLTLGFGLAPSSNVNGGPTTNVLVIGGIEFVNPDAVPLSGLVATLDLGAIYTLDIAPRQTLRFALRGFTSQVALSQDAQEEVPTAKGSDFAQADLLARVGWSIGSADGRRRSFVDAAVGREWLGGDALADRVVLTFRQEFIVGSTDRLAFDLSGERTFRLDEDLRSSEAIRVGADWLHVLPWGDRAGVILQFSEEVSDAASIANRAANLRISYAKAAPVMDMALSGYIEFDAKNYLEPLYSADPREDRGIGLGLTAAFLSLDYMGFAPEIGIYGNRTRSTVALYDTETFEVRLGIRSSF